MLGILAMAAVMILNVTALAEGDKPYAGTTIEYAVNYQQDKR